MMETGKMKSPLEVWIYGEADGGQICFSAKIISPSGEVTQVERLPLSVSLSYGVFHEAEVFEGVLREIMISQGMTHLTPTGFTQIPREGYPSTWAFTLEAL